MRLPFDKGNPTEQAIRDHFENCIRCSEVEDLQSGMRFLERHSNRNSNRVPQIVRHIGREMNRVHYQRAFNN